MTDEVVLILKVNLFDAFEVEDCLVLLYFTHILSYVHLAVPHKPIF
jgi:hypothetical protein